jgi:hypothetical protein
MLTPLIAFHGNISRRWWPKYHAWVIFALP